MVQCLQCGWSAPKALEIGGQSPTLPELADYVQDCGKRGRSLRFLLVSAT